MEAKNLSRKSLGRIGFRTLLILPISTFMLTNTACTREVPTVKSTVTLSFPKSRAGFNKAGNGTLTASATPFHVILNINSTSDSSTSINRAFSKHGRGGVINTIGNQFNVEVPTNKPLRFQVLWVEQNDQGGMAIYYGIAEETVTTQTTVDIFLGATPINGSTPVSDGQIGGRMLTSSNAGPTSPIRIMYQPTVGPAMLIETGEIINGWFSLFGLEGMALSYKLDDDTELFGAPQNLSSFASSSPEKVVIHVPSHWRSINYNSGPREVSAASRVVLGWFGGSGFVTGKSICYPDAPDVINGAYTTAVETNSTRINFDFNSTLATDAHVVGGGGTPGSSGGSGTLCTASGTVYSNYLSVNTGSLTSHDNVLPIRGAFQPYSWNNGYGRYINVDFAGTTLNVQWKYLLDVYSVSASKGVNGADVYLRVMTAANADTVFKSYKDGDDRVMCNELINNGFNLISANHPAPSGVNVDDSVTYTVSSTSAYDFGTALTEGRVQIAVCPYGTTGYANKTYFSGLDFQNYMSGGISSQDATSLEIQLPNGSAAGKFAAQVCNPVEIRGKHLGGRGMFPASFSVNLSSSDTSYTKFFINPSDCNNGTNGVNAITSLNNPMGDTAVIFVKSTQSSPLAGVSLTFTDAAANMPPVTATVDYLALPTFGTGQNTKKFKLRMPVGDFRPYACIPITMEQWYDNEAGVAMLGAFSSNAVIRATGMPTGFNFYGDPMCGGAPNGAALDFNFAGSVIGVTRYVKYSAPYSAVAASTNFSWSAITDGANVSDARFMAAPVVGIPATVAVATGAVTLPVDKPGPFTQLKIFVQQNITSNGCVPVQVNLQDVNNYFTAGDASITVNLTTSNATGSFYASNVSTVCTTPLGGYGTPAQITIPIGKERFVLYYKDTGGSGTLNLSAVSVSPVRSSGPVPVTLAP